MNRKGGWGAHNTQTGQTIIFKNREKKSRKQPELDSITCIGFGGVKDLIKDLVRPPLIRGHFPGHTAGNYGMLERAVESVRASGTPMPESWWRQMWLADKEKKLIDDVFFLLRWADPATFTASALEVKQLLPYAARTPPPPPQTLPLPPSQHPPCWLCKGRDPSCFPTPCSREGSVAKVSLAPRSCVPVSACG